MMSKFDLQLSKDLYEKLRSRVYKVLYPEGIPLDVGCEVRVERTPFTLQATRVVDYVDKVVYLNLGHGLISIHESEVKANLGKPLSLQDVLRAIDISRSRYSRYCLMSPSGWLMLSSDGKLVRLVQLELSLPILKQEERVLEVLIELLD
jgi:hypothetical protein